MHLKEIKLKWNFLVSVILLLASNGLFAGGTIKGITKVEDTEFEVGEQFMVQYILRSNGQQLQGNYRVSGDDFGSLDLIGKNSGNSTSIVNGSVSQDLTLTYYFQSKKPGVFTIPGIRFIFNGKEYPCQPKTIKITKPKKDSRVNGDLMLQLNPNKTSVYVGEPVRVDLQWYSAFNTKGFQLKELPKFDGFIVKSIPSKTQNKIRTINGKKYITNKNYTFILTPIKQGKIKLPKVKGDMYLTTGRGFFTQTETREISSDRITLTIKPLPSGPNGVSKSVIVGEFKVKTKLDKKELNVNDAVTLKITLSGSGNLNTLNDLPINFPSAFETLPTTVKNNVKTTLNGINGSKTFEFVAIPRQPGKFEIPSIKIWAFNPKNKKYYTIKSDPVSINVTGTSTADINPYISSNGGKDVELQGSDIRYLNEVKSLSNVSKSQFTGSFSQYIFLIIGLLGFGIGIFAFKERTQSKTEVKTNKKAKANRVAQKYLKDAKREINGDKNKFYELVDESINNYLLAKLMIDQSELKKEIITQVLQKQNVEDSLIKKTLQVSNDCKMARFSPIVLPPTEMYSQAESIINELERQLK